jgi:hypothetical protein
MMTKTMQQLDANSNPIQGLMSSQSVTWPVTHSHASQALATQAGVTGKQHVVTGFIVSTDLAGAVCEVKVDSTVKLHFTMIAGTVPYTLPTALAGVVGGAVSVTVNGTSACTANLLGFTLDPLPT